MHLSSAARPIVNCTSSWTSHCSPQIAVLAAVQVLQEAAAVDAKAAAGQSITPLCGLPLAVKDSIDCLPYPTSAATPALLGEHSDSWACLLHKLIAHCLPGFCCAHAQQDMWYSCICDYLHIPLSARTSSMKSNHGILHNCCSERLWPASCLSRLPSNAS